jgi:hypothetical protein
VDLTTAITFGAVGGSVIEAMVFYSHISAWQSARHRALTNRRSLPSLRRYVDPLSDALAALTRILLGAAAGWLFHSEITGVYAAVAVGASAPALLRQMGAVKSLHDAVQGFDANAIEDGAVGRDEADAMGTAGG